MVRVLPSGIESPLIKYAIRKLNPEIFTHPVWVRFSQNGVSDSLSLISDLFSVAKNLQENDPSGACQILLICAYYQNYVGQSYNALRTTQQAVSLAEHTDLARETIWAMWGACAISIQQGNYKQAASYFVDLQVAFGKQNEWMLANFIDILRQSFLQPTIAIKHSELPRDPPFEDLLTFTFDWLQHWGFSDELAESEFAVISDHPVSHTTKQATLSKSFFSIQRWQGRWHNLMLAIRGELKLQWTETRSQSAKSRSSFWDSILGSLQLHSSGRTMDTQTTDHIPQIRNTALLPPAKESSPPKAKPRKKKQASRVKKVSRNQRGAQANTFIPVTVHMLGAFSMMIGDTMVKLSTSRGLSVLKYLLLNHKQNISREVLMDVFWPDADTETARNNLNVAMHNMRKALRIVIFLPVIVFEDGAYGLAPDLQVWLDLEEFERCIKDGQRLEARDQFTAAVTEYEAAISLYQGDFLEQNLYEEWTVLERERLRVAYLDTLDRLSQIYFNQERYSACITVCQLILTRDRCREDAHCLLMRCYSRQGQYHLAMRQYQICVEALYAELEVAPAPETTKLYEQIRHHEHI